MERSASSSTNLLEPLTTTETVLAVEEAPVTYIRELLITHRTVVIWQAIVGWTFALPRQFNDEHPMFSSCQASTMTLVQNEAIFRVPSNDIG